MRIPIKGGMTIPNIATFDHGTCDGGGERRRQSRKAWGGFFA